MKNSTTLRKTTITKLTKGLSMLVRMRPLTKRVKMKDIAAVSGVSERTAYGTGGPDEILDLQKQLLIEEVKDIYKRYGKFGKKILLRKILELIKKEKSYFTMSIAQKTDLHFADILLPVKNEFIDPSLPEELRENFYYQFINDFFGVIKRWQLEGFSRSRIDTHVDVILACVSNFYRSTQPFNAYLDH